MYAFNSIALAVLAVSSAVVAQFEPLDVNHELFARSPIAAEFQPLEMAASHTLRDVVPLSERELTGTKTQHLPRTHKAYARGIKGNSVRNQYAAVRLQDALVSAKAQIGPIHASISVTCQNAHHLKPHEVCNQIRPHLDHCHHVISDCGGHIHRIPHQTCPSQAPHNPPSVPGCSGLISALIQEIEALIDEIHGLTASNAELKALLEEYVEKLDDQLSSIVHGSETAVTGVTDYVSSFSRNSLSHMKSMKFKSLPASLGH